MVVKITAFFMKTTEITHFYNHKSADFHSKSHRLIKVSIDNKDFCADFHKKKITSTNECDLDVIEKMLKTKIKNNAKSLFFPLVNCKKTTQK